MRFIDNWRPAFGSTDTHQIKVGQVIAWDYRAWEVMHLSERAEPNEHGHDTRVTLRRLHGQKHDRENSVADTAFAIRATWRVEVYREGRVWLCSCCGHPAPCRNTVAQEVAARSAQEFEKRLNRMGPGLCYACGEAITKRQDRVTFPGEHADFPGGPAPTFHTRKSCYGGRAAYGRRAGLDPMGRVIPPPCMGTFVRHGDGTYECTNDECPGPRSEHRVYSACYGHGCTDCGKSHGCTPAGTETRRTTP